MIIAACCCAAAFIPALAVPQCRAAAGQPNIILISLNALRADHLAPYGYARDTAPNITRLAADAAVFERAVAQSHWTLPSLASMFTSKYVHSHGLYQRGGRLSEKELTLAEALKAGGYKTAAFTGGLDMSGVYGLNQGFDVYFDDTGTKPMGSFKELMPKALTWLTAQRGSRFFLFLDSYDIHPPFDKTCAGTNSSAYAGVLKDRQLDYNLLNTFRNNTLASEAKIIQLTKEDIDYINVRYDCGIAYADKFIGELLAKLDELGLAGNTALILTSEHGEALGEHGTFDRFGSGNLYDEVIRVPLIIKPAGKNLKGKRVAPQAQIIDLLPTVLDFAGLSPAAGAQGQSLLPLLEAAQEPADFNRNVYSEAGPAKWALRTYAWKLLYNNGAYSLYDLTRDAGELKNAARENPTVVYELAQKLMAWRRTTRTARSPGDTRIELTEEMKSKLRAAGYWE